MAVSKCGYVNYACVILNIVDLMILLAFLMLNCYGSHMACSLTKRKKINLHCPVLFVYGSIIFTTRHNSFMPDLIRVGPAYKKVVGTQF